MIHPADKLAADRAEFTTRFKAWVEQGRDLMNEGDALDIDCKFGISPKEIPGKPRRWNMEWSVFSRPRRVAGEG